jgi:hypothetical protein
VIALEKALSHDCLKDNVFAKRGLSEKVSFTFPRRYWRMKCFVQHSNFLSLLLLPSSKTTGQMSRLDLPLQQSMEMVFIEKKCHPSPLLLFFFLLHLTHGTVVEPQSIRLWR